MIAADQTFIFSKFKLIFKSNTKFLSKVQSHSKCTRDRQWHLWCVFLMRPFVTRFACFFVLVFHALLYWANSLAFVIEYSISMTILLTRLSYGMRRWKFINICTRSNITIFTPKSASLCYQLSLCLWTVDEHLYSTLPDGYLETL